LEQDDLAVKTEVILFADEGVEADVDGVASRESMFDPVPDLDVGRVFIADFDDLLDDRVLSEVGDQHGLIDFLVILLSEDRGVRFEGWLQ